MLFKRTEVQAELLSGILEALSSHSQGDNEGKKHAAEFLISLSKSDNFEMTLMFIDDKEKDKLKKIGEGGKGQKDVYNKYNKAYSAAF